jgi:hypothetical protein
MALTYEILGIRPLLIDKLNNDPISKSGMDCTEEAAKTDFPPVSQVSRPTGLA